MKITQDNHDDETLLHSDSLLIKILNILNFLSVLWYQIQYFYKIEYASLKKWKVEWDNC
jgi:hypothetical protein